MHPGAARLLALILGLLVLLGHVQVWQVMALAFCLGIVNAFDMPIRQSFVVEMVGREDIASAVALNSAAFNAARVIGPAVAGLLIGVIGIGPAVPAQFGELSRGHRGVPADGRAPAPVAGPCATLDATRSGGITDSLVEGLRYVRATPIILLCVVAHRHGVAVRAQLPGVRVRWWRADVLGGGAETYGFLMAAAGVGSLVSALIARVRGSGDPRHGCSWAGTLAGVAVRAPASRPCCR